MVEMCNLHFLLNTAIIAAFLIMQESTNFPKRKYRQVDFRIALAQLLIGTFRTPKSTAGRQSFQFNHAQVPKANRQNVLLQELL